MSELPSVTAYDGPEADRMYTLIENIQKSGLEEWVKKFTQKAMEDFTYDVEGRLVDALTDSIPIEVMKAATELAERYIAEALAGSDEKMRSLFGISHPSYRYKPSAWAILDGFGKTGSDEIVKELCKRHRGLLMSERQMCLEYENKVLREEIVTLKTRLEASRDY